jgi:hypothetical protein
LVSQHGQRAADDLVADIFLYDHFVPRRPMLLKNFVSRASSLSQQWSLPQLLANYGNLSLTVGDIPYVSSFH